MYAASSWQPAVAILPGCQIALVIDEHLTGHLRTSMHASDVLNLR